MLYLTYEIVTKRGKYPIVSYYPYMTTKMSSKILPRILKTVSESFPDEKFVYAKLIDITKE